ncbi:Hypothetical predicted protein [Paramuricea clavata]|uniref:Uncharacterized protein n=1 Tax=Paramuricea clavata TaxID=317549 RepID=A0A7D9KLC7_PARCT|nr:Hypothetical predicted protein [Paramuricea clavata]
MSPTTFEQLLSWIGPLLQRATTKMREPIGPSERLCVCLRYLVTGDAQVTIAASYRISAAVVGRIINETCELLWNTLIEKGYVKHPSTENEWKVIAEEFETCWNFPHCVRAIDSKHVLMQAPGNSGSAYFKYKKTFSIVLMAVCNAKYQFTLVDIGDIGRQSDSSVYGCSHLGYAIENNLLNISSESKLTNSEKVLPYVFIGDDAFGLKTYGAFSMSKITLCVQITLWHLEMSLCNFSIALWHLEMSLCNFSIALWHLEMSLCNFKPYI